MSEVPLEGVSTLTRLYVEKSLVPDTLHAGFSRRHAILARNTQANILGSVATLPEFGEDTASRVMQRVEQIHNVAQERHRDELTTYRAAVALDEYLYTTQWRYPGEENRPHQRQALFETLNMFSRGGKEGYIEQATSIGKTYIEAKLAEAGYKAGMRVLILTPMLGIAKDSIVGDAPDPEDRKGLARFAPNIDRSHIGEHFGGTKATPEDPVVVSTYASFNRFAVSGELGEFDMILCDEGHMGLGDVTSNNLRNFSPHAVKIGLTATPDYGQNKSLSQLFPERIHGIDLREAVDEGLTAPIHALLVETGENLEVLDPYRKDFSERELQTLINRKSRNEQSVGFVKAFVGDGRKVLVFCAPGNKLEHAKMMAKRYAEEEVEVTVVNEETGKEEKIRRKIIAEAIGSFQSPDQQARIRARFEAGEIDVLTSVDAIGLGWDSQIASAIVSLRPRGTLLSKIQEIGRAIRKKKDGRHTILVDFVDRVAGKEQKTVFHALGEETISIGKIYGPSSHLRLGDETPTSYLRKLLEQAVYDRLQVMDGRLLSELKLPYEGRGRVYRKDYEKTLAHEGLGLEDQLIDLPAKFGAAVEQIESEFLAQNHRLPSSAEMVDELVSREIAKNWGSITNERIALQALEILLGVERLGDDVFDLPDEVELEAQAYLGYKKDLIPKLLDLLTERERKIIELSFGLHDGKVHTQQEIGATLGITGERVRQLESKALDKLRDSEILELAFEDDEESRVLTAWPEVLSAEDLQALKELDRIDYLAALRHEVKKAQRYGRARTRVVNTIDALLDISEPKSYESWSNKGAHLEVQSALSRFFKRHEIKDFTIRRKYVHDLARLIEEDNEEISRRYSPANFTKETERVAEFRKNWLEPALEDLQVTTLQRR